MTLLAVPLAVVLFAATAYRLDFGTWNPLEAPAVVPYQGCMFTPTGTVESLDAATRFEHNASAYAAMPVRRVATLPNLMGVYALPLGPGAGPCSAAPMDVYVQVSNSQFRLYRRCCGP